MPTNAVAVGSTACDVLTDAVVACQYRVKSNHTRSLWHHFFSFFFFKLQLCRHRPPFGLQLLEVPLLHCCWMQHLLRLLRWQSASAYGRIWHPMFVRQFQNHRPNRTEDSRPRLHWPTCKHKSYCKHHGDNTYEHFTCMQSANKCCGGRLNSKRVWTSDVAMWLTALPNI